MDTPSQQNLNQLPPGTILGDFKITGVVGEGGFGIVYLAYEATLDRTVAIKEYLPSSIAGRTGNQSVMVRSQLNTNAFASGLKNFLREAQLLARFSHPAMVEVHRVWEQNSTAYMAMRFYPGKTLRELRQSANEFDEMSIRRVLEPVFDALSLLHAQNVIHRDVSPDNILMRGNGAPVLLDLGAARLVIGGMTQALTTVLKPGYAPIEQYVDDGTMHQGPWTDVYGLGAVLYFLLTGSPPPQAVARMITDPLKNLASVATVKVPDFFTEAVVKALAVRPENRYQSVDELREALRWTEPLAEPRTTYVRIDTPTRTGTAAPTTLPPATASSKTAPAVAPAPISMPLDRVFEQDSDATVVWKGPPITGQPPVAPPPPPLRSASAPPPPPPSPPAAAPSMQPRREYGEAPARGSKSWLFAALAAVVVAAGAGYFFLMRPAGSPPPVTTAAPSEPGSGVATNTTTTNTGITTTAPATTTTAVTTSALAIASPANEKNATESRVPAPTAATQQPNKTTPEPAKATAESKPREPARLTTDEQAKAQKEAEEKARAKQEAQEKAAKAKQEADERIKKARAEADERAAAAAQAAVEERVRREKAEQEAERQAVLRAAQEAEKRGKSPSTVPTPPPVQRSVNELSALALAAYKRGELLAARGFWNEIASHPEANARSRATAFSNQAMSYCLNGDEGNCERFFTSALRADRSWSADPGERDHPHVKPSYTRALRAARGGGY